EALAADTVDRRRHHVQPDAPAGGLRHPPAGGEPRREEQPEDLVVAQRGGGRVVQQAGLHRLLAQPLDVDAGAVVGDLEPDPGPGGGGAQADAPGARLAAALAHLRGLDAVVDGVAHQVEQRLLELTRDAAVEPRLLALHRHLDLALERAPDLPRVAGAAAASACDRAAPRRRAAAGAARSRRPWRRGAAWRRERSAPVPAGARAPPPR